MSIPPLESATVPLHLTTPREQSLDWRACVGLRGFLGRRMDGVPPSIKQILLPFFHEQHDTPAPFRLMLENSDPISGIHRIRLLTFGRNAVPILNCFIDLLNSAAGELHLPKHSLPFEVAPIETFEQGSFHLRQDDDILDVESETTSIVVSSCSPFFSKTNSGRLFSDGKWSELLAIRYADLAGVRRKSVLNTMSKISGDSEYQSKPIQLMLGGDVRTRTGYFFRVRFFQPTFSTIRAIELLCQLGLGKHTAYGAGTFRLEMVE